MDSTRLPGKVLRKINGKPVLYYVVRQTLASKSIHDVIIATTRSAKDNKIVKFCKSGGFKYYRGSENDVLDRYYKTAKKFGCKFIVRIGADSPLIDPNLIDRTIRKFFTNSYDYVGTNIEWEKNEWKNSPCRFPHGMNVEIVSFKTLEKAWKDAKLPSEREHVLPYVRFNPKIFHISNVKNKEDLSYIRCTIDKYIDLKFVRELYKRFPREKKIITLNDIKKIICKEPSLLEINSGISFDEGYKKSLKKDLRYKKRS